MNVIHRRLTLDQVRRKIGSTGAFDGPNPACGNGSYHARCHLSAGHVTCPVCIAIQLNLPHWLR